jgi:hypothetical protein
MLGPKTGWTFASEGGIPSQHIWFLSGASEVRAMVMSGESKKHIMTALLVMATLSGAWAFCEIAIAGSHRPDGWWRNGDCSGCSFSPYLAASARH